MHQKDMDAVRMHFQGAVAVVQKFGSPYRMDRLAQKIIASFVCWTSFAPPNTLLVPFAELVWSSSFYTSTEKVECPESHTGAYYFTILNPARSNQSGSRRAHAPGKTNNVKEAEANTANNPFVGRLAPLQDPNPTRTIAPVLRIATQHITALSRLARRARHSSLSHQELAELMAGICCGGQRLGSIKPEKLTTLEDCIRMTTLVHYFADVVPFEGEDEPRITHFTEGVRAQLLTIDLEAQIQEWPEVFLWIAVVMGVFSKEDSWIYFQDLLRLACGHLKILKWSGVIEVIDQFQPISSEPFLEICEAFWMTSRTLKSVRLAGGKIRGHIYTTEILDEV